MPLSPKHCASLCGSSGTDRLFRFQPSPVELISCNNSNTYHIPTIWQFNPMSYVYDIPRGSNNKISIVLLGTDFCCFSTSFICLVSSLLHNAALLPWLFEISQKYLSYKPTKEAWILFVLLANDIHLQFTKS